jgi:hypothetical protein
MLRVRLGLSCQLGGGRQFIFAELVRLGTAEDAGIFTATKPPVAAAMPLRAALRRQSAV